MRIQEKRGALSCAVARLVAREQRKGLSKATVKSTKNALSAMLSDACRDRILAVNPARGVELPLMADPQPMRIPEHEELRDLLKMLAQREDPADRELGRILHFMALTGMRNGEVFATTWQDVDLDKGLLVVSKGIAKGAHGRRRVSDRTKTGVRRTIPLGPKAVELLLEQRDYVETVRAKARVWTENGFIFPTSRGTFKEYNNMLRRLRRAAPDWQHAFHIQRHWFASSGFESGASEVDIAELLGHSPNITRALYGHLFEKRAETLIRAAESNLEWDA